MAKKIVIDGLSNKNINAAIKEVRKYKAWVEEKEKELISRLAAVGADVARVTFASATYDGINDVTVRVDSTGSVAVIYAEGQAVAFIEFGSGDRYGHGHPKAGELGMGAGTYPSEKGHWDDPKGWWYAHGKHTYGNPPAMAMVQAIQRMQEEITTIAREVFSTP